jgi:guanylate kinase
VKPRVVVLSAPSGGGKTTIAKAVRDRYPDRFGFSVSATTRKPRAGETDGVDYHFWSRHRFETELAQGKFLEHAEYAGELYGTLKSEIDRVLNSGRHVLLDIEVEGARQIRERYPPPNSISIFVLPSEPKVLLERLVKRESESSQELQKRLDRAEHEFTQSVHFDRWIRNDDLERAVAEVVAAAQDEGFLTRSPKDFQWMLDYSVGLRTEAAKLWDRRHSTKG